MPESRLQRTRRAYRLESDEGAEMRRRYVEPLFKGNPFSCHASMHWWPRKMESRDADTRCYCGAMTWADAVANAAKVAAGKATREALRES